MKKERIMFFWKKEKDGNEENKGKTSLSFASLACCLLGILLAVFIAVFVL